MTSQVASGLTWVWISCLKYFVFQSMFGREWKGEETTNTHLAQHLDRDLTAQDQRGGAPWGAPTTSRDRMRVCVHRTECMYICLFVLLYMSYVSQKEILAVWKGVQINHIHIKTTHSGSNIGSNMTHSKTFWWHDMTINEERDWGGN
jgi:hypothetical protein